MTTMSDVITSTDIVYGILVELTFHRVNPISARNHFSGARTWTRKTREWYTLSDFTVA